MNDDPQSLKNLMDLSPLVVVGVLVLPVVAVLAWIAFD